MIKELPVSTGALNGWSLFIVLGALVWIVGGNLIIARHFKRRGMAATEGLKPLGLLKISFSVRDLVALAAVAGLGMGLVIFGAAQL